MWSYIILIGLYTKLEESKKHTKAMLDSWLNITGVENGSSTKQSTRPTGNSPTYNPPPINQGGINNNNNGEYDWVFGIKR